MILTVALGRGHSVCPLRSALYFCGAAQNNGKDIGCGYAHKAPKECPLRKEDVVVRKEE